MGLILLEALLALCIFIVIVWWTMFSGRSKGELRHAPAPSEQPQSEANGDVNSTARNEEAPTTAPTANATPDDTRR
jgi:cytoskeletal protein RodZ